VAQTPAVALEFTHVAKRLGSRWVLRDVNFTLARGETAVVLGPNGAGKTTLLKLAARTWTPSHGHIRWFGGEAAESEGDVRIGYLGHASFLYRALSGLENLEFYARLYGLKRPRASAEAALERVGLTAFRFEPVRRYSRGMEQRCAIARAFLASPDLLLLDEPYTSLDLQATGVLDELVRGTTGRGGAALVITHQLHEAERLGDRTAILWQGRIVRSAESGEFAALAAAYRTLFERREHDGA
jgi:heme exporter protein A